jgi:cyclohexadieny/prephenate dehydrogenase
MKGPPCSFTILLYPRPTPSISRAGPGDSDSSASCYNLRIARPFANSAASMKIGTLTIVGVGLIGGSVGLAARRRGIAARVIGVGRRRETVDRALRIGAVTHGLVDLRAGVVGADLVMFCTPVDKIVAGVLEAALACPEEAVLTDAGSTKGEIVAALEAALPPPTRFVGGHPIAGSEKQGVEHATADLFEGRVAVVTPTPRTNRAALERVMDFWRALGAQMRIMDPAAHDRALAWTSHLPHLIAAGLARLLPAGLQGLTGSGFRDATRIAAGDPSLWTGILLQNRDALLESMQELRSGLGRWQAALEARDRPALETLLTEAKRVRDALGN